MLKSAQQFLHEECVEEVQKSLFTMYTGSSRFFIVVINIARRHEAAGSSCMTGK